MAGSVAAIHDQEAMRSGLRPFTVEDLCGVDTVGRVLRCDDP